MRKILILALLLCVQQAALRAQHVVPAQAGIPIQSLGFADTVSLPFFDDFSSHTVYTPNIQRWSVAGGVYINNEFAANPRSLGVATLDIIDSQGRVYPQANSTGFAADTLCSLPLRLSGRSGVHINFAYQPGGLLDVPEVSDSLVLQWSATPSLAYTWQSIWCANTNATLAVPPTNITEVNRLTQQTTLRTDSVTAVFHVVTVDVPVSMVKPGAAFRFVNYATRANNQEVRGVQSNCDLWHLDYVCVDTLPIDPRFVDLALQRPLRSLLRDYEIMPWRHLQGSTLAQQEQLASAEVGNQLPVRFRVSNLSPYSSSFLTAGSLTSHYSGLTLQYAWGDNVIQKDTTRAFVRSIPPTDLLNSAPRNMDSVELDVQLYIADYLSINTPFPLRRDFLKNDTSRYTQRFYPCYAYDDGTAENGFGVFGVNSTGTQIAVKYYSYLPDTLTGVYLYFNNTLDGGNLLPFTLAVWAPDAYGYPGKLLYSHKGAQARFDSLNKYVYYPLNNKIMVSGTFFVGLIQQEPGMLNIGLDVNTSPKDKTYVHYEGYWRLSGERGSLMIRPSFVYNPSISFANSTGVAPRHLAALYLYPNPTHTAFSLMLPPEWAPLPLQCKVYSLQGQLLWQGNATQEAIPVSGWPAGVYMVQVLHNNTLLGVQKLLVQ